MGLQSTPWVNPAWEQGSGMMRAMAVPSPGKLKRVEAMLPGAPWVRYCGVSAQVLFRATELFLIVSYEKNANKRFLMIGPPTLPPIWLNRFETRLTARIP